MTPKTVPFDASCDRSTSGWVQYCRFLPGLGDLHVVAPAAAPQDVVRPFEGKSADDALASHYCDFGLQAYEKKRFLPMVSLREVLFVPSWGLGFPRPCTKRGRQQKWYKDFWLLHSQRFSRLWLYRAVRTVLRYPLLRIWPCYRRSRLTDLFTKNLCCGRGQAPVRHTPFSRGCA